MARSSCSRLQREGFQPLAIEYDVNCGFIISGFHYVEICSFHIQFFESFTHERVLILSNAFSAFEMMTWFLSFLPLMWHHIYWFACWPVLAFHLITMYHSFNVLLIWFASILFRIIISVFINNIGLKFSLPVASLCSLGIWVMLDL